MTTKTTKTSKSAARKSHMPAARAPRGPAPGGSAGTHSRAPSGPADGAATPTPSHSELISIQWRRERGDLNLDNFLLAIFLMRLGTLVDQAFHRMCLRRYSISGGDMRVLLALRRGGSPYVRRPTDLFKALLVTSGAVTKKVDRLVEAGFAERLSDPSHNGGFLVHLTRRGLQIVEEAVEHLANSSVIGPAMAQLPPAERQAGSAFVLAVLSALEQQEPESGDDAD